MLALDTIVQDGDRICVTPRNIKAAAPGDYTDGFATIEHAAEFLAVGKTTIRKLIDVGDLKAIHIPGVRAVRIPWQALRAYAAELCGDVDNGQAQT